ncbi:signal recognition particle-docking protein FtsY [Pseudaquabacterium rugosum]|uniref:Signal recognition particle receptor FtsY n=1 Tax=Pseudaquabacterium rugosum TaxID=2984194 RepID=A0ABU9B3Y2_9BURK
MFSFFKKKSAPPDAPAPGAVPAPVAAPAAEPSAAAPAPASWWQRLTGGAKTAEQAPEGAVPPAPAAPATPPAVPPALPATPVASPPVAAPAPAVGAPAAGRGAMPAPVSAATPSAGAAPPLAPAHVPPAPPSVPAVIAPAVAPVVAVPQPSPAPAPAPARAGWLDRLKNGLRKTGSSIAQVFTGTRIDDALYEELEAALLMADAGVKASEHLLADLKRRVKDSKATEPAAVRGLLADALAELLRPLERGLEIGRHEPTVMMVVGVNGAGKTTSIGKLTKHLADADQRVLLAAADTFRAAAREQLGIWADRNKVEIVSQEGADPAAVTFDAVTAAKARGRDVVIADTAGRLPTQLHLMEELKKIKRVIAKADGSAPHEVLLVVDGNTGQNALAQVKSFDEALGLTGLIVTKLDGTAKGGVLAAIALWARERAAGAVPVYFIGVGEKLEDLQTFSAREFAQALLE